MIRRSRNARNQIKKSLQGKKGEATKWITNTEPGRDKGPLYSPKQVPQIAGGKIKKGYHRARPRHKGEEKATGCIRGKTKANILTPRPSNSLSQRGGTSKHAPEGKKRKKKSRGDRETRLPK